MKRTLTLFSFLALFGSTLWAQSKAPTFSTASDPVYYQVKFKNGKFVLEDKGNNALLTLAANTLTDDNRLFAFIGTESNFKIISSNGRYIGVKNATPSKGTSGDFIYSTTENNAATFTLKKAGTGYFTISRTSDTNTSFNEWAGAAVGNNIGFWSNGDTNNPLYFESPYFSSIEKPTYWQLMFNSTSRYLANKNAGELIATGNTTGEENQLFALVGNASNFMIYSKAGLYVNTKSGTATNGQSGTFLASTTKATEAVKFTTVNVDNAKGTFEIARTTDKSKTFNPWGGNSVPSNNIGFWTAGDNSNKMILVAPSEPMEFNNIKGATAFEKESKHTLWYNQPTTTTTVSNKWMEYSLPIGNGQLGASLFGGVKTDEIQFNEKTLWTGGPNDMGGYGKYLNYGSVFVTNIAPQGSTATTDYTRFLDIEKGVAGVNFTDADGTKITRRYISSEPDKVIAVQYKAVGTNKLNLRFSAIPGEETNSSEVAYTADGYGTFSGKLTTVFHNARFKVVPVDGTLTANENGVQVEGATEVLLVLGAGTSFDSSVPARTSGNADDLKNRILTAVDAAASKGWSNLYTAHVDNFTSYTHRVNLQLNDAASDKNTEDLIKFYNKSEANKKSDEGIFLEQLYFNFGRYLAISSSRGVNVPSNLQGIWNDKANAPWNSDIHTNINVQMNYWPAEPTNLSELHEPFLNYIIDNAASKNWKAAAQRGGQSKGWTVFTESNIFGGMSTWGSNYFVANSWYVSHLWQHYRYTLDKEYLKRAFPAMWSSAQFWMERMIKDRKVKDNTYVCPDEYSPEQNDHPKEDGTAHAQQLVMSNLQSCMEAIQILGASTVGLSEADVNKLANYIKNTDTGLHVEEYKGDWGDWATNFGIKKGDKLLKEWKYTPYSVSNDKGHRHMSHLMCLYPLNQVQPGDNYYEAAVNALKLRGDAATGWSMGWKVNLWARAKDGNHARLIIKNALKHSTSYGTDQYAGGIYYNLYDSHAPFQIDGNFGVCAGISELLLQSHNDVIEILPALPTDWKKGSVTGLKAVGNFTVDIEWANGKATKVNIISHKGSPLRVSGGLLHNVEVLVDGKGAEVVAEEVQEGRPGVYQIKNVGEGQHVSIDFSRPSIPPSNISAVKQQQTNEKFYDLSGHRVHRNATGIVISNRQKVIH